MTDDMPNMPLAPITVTLRDVTSSEYRWYRLQHGPIQHSIAYITTKATIEHGRAFMIDTHFKSSRVKCGVLLWDCFVLLGQVRRFWWHSSFTTLHSRDVTWPAWRPKSSESRLFIKQRVTLTTTETSTLVDITGSVRGKFTCHHRYLKRVITTES